MNNVLFIILALGFVFLNAFFVAAEFAMVKLRHTRVQNIKKNQLFGLRGRILYRVHTQLDTYLSACQLGITLSSLGLGWVGEPAFAHLLTPFLYWMNIHSVEIIKIISFGVAFSLISFLHIVIGELMPKSIAIRQSESISLITAVPLYIFYWIMYPFIETLNMSANGLLKIFHLDTVHKGEHVYSPDEIKFILKTSHAQDKLSPKHREMLIKMLEFSQLEAIDVMKPIEEMISIPASATLEEKRQIIQQYKYTRYPVYQNINNNINNITGILHAKDFILHHDSAPVILRPVVKVERSTKAVKVLDYFREGRTHFALVYHDEKPIGFITLENLLYALMGKMRDEFNFTQEDWQKVNEKSFLIKGASPVYVVEQLIDKDLSHFHVDTVAGLLLENLGDMPKVGDKWVQPEFTLEVKKVKGPKILEVLLIKK
jgi:CBS domain containing-hemolysin-like protein